VLFAKSGTGLSNILAPTRVAPLTASTGALRSGGVTTSIPVASAPIPVASLAFSNKVLLSALSVFGAIADSIT